MSSTSAAFVHPSRSHSYQGNDSIQIAGREAYAGGAIYCATKHACVLPPFHWTCLPLFSCRVNAFTGALMRELVDTPIRVTEIQPGASMSGFRLPFIHSGVRRHGRDRYTLPSSVTRPCLRTDLRTEFSIVRFRGDKSAADKVYDGLDPCT